jgi:hypothetical protein
MSTAQLRFIRPNYFHTETNVFSAKHRVRFEVLTVLKVLTLGFCVVAPCEPVRDR